MTLDLLVYQISRTGQARTDQGRPGHTMTDQERQGQTKSDMVRPGQTRAYQDKTRHTRNTWNTLIFWKFPVSRFFFSWRRPSAMLPIFSSLVISTKKLQIVGDIYTQNWSIWGKFLSRPLPRGCLALNLALPVVPKHQNQANTTCGASSQPDLIHSDAHVQIFWHSR